MKEKKEPKERKPRSAQRDALRAKNWREYTATVEDIEQFLSDNVLLRHNVVAGRVEYRIPDAWPSESGGQVWLPISDRKSCGQRGYVVELRTGEEIQRLQRRMVDDDDVDSGHYGQ